MKFSGSLSHTTALPTAELVCTPYCPLLSRSGHAASCSWKDCRQCAGSEGRADRPLEMVWFFSILLHCGQQQTAQCLCRWTVPLMVSIVSLGFTHFLAFPLFTHRSRFCRKARLRSLLSGTQYTYVFVVLWVTGIVELASVL